MTTTQTVTIEVVDTPSRSKGWARFKVTDASGKALVRSSTGNEWLYAGKDVEVEAGAKIVVVSQVCLKVGKGFRSREETDTEEYEMTVGEGEAVIYHRPGSQGQRLRVIGAVEA